MATVLFKTGLINVAPPWLRKLLGKKLLEAIGEQIDVLDDYAVQGVKLRFPVDAPDPSALGMLGRERRIRRGPGEAAITYARRLRRWLDDHKGRGGPYALLNQLDAFFESWLNVRMDVVYASGTRRWIDAAVPGVITRDSITWNADGSGKWARFWVFYYVPTSIPGVGDTIITQAGDTIITQAGDTLITDGTISPSELSEDEREIFRCIPREWSAGHIDRVTAVLLWGDARLVGYPPGRLVGEPGMVVGPAQQPVILPIEA